MNAVLALLGRLCLSALFLGDAFAKITDFDGTRAGMESVGMPSPTILLVGAILLLVVGGLSVLLGFQARTGAVLLVIFLVPATYYFHLDFDDPMQKIQFMKNLAILGGLLYVAGGGPGRYSVDGRRRAAKT